MKLPERRVCALCGHDDDVTIMPAPDGNGWQYTCPPGPSHTDARVWTVTEPAAFVGRDGVTAELGLYDDLPSLIAPGEPWLEYGVVEYRYRRLHHDRYGEVIRRYGHRSVEPKPFTASALIAKALGRSPARAFSPCGGGQPPGTGRTTVRSATGPYRPCPRTTTP